MRFIDFISVVEVSINGRIKWLLRGLQEFVYGRVNNHRYFQTKHHMDSTQNKILPKGTVILNGTYQCSRFNDGIVFAAARLLLFLHWYEIIKSLPRLCILYISEISFINFISVVEVSINGRIKRLLHGLQARVCEKDSIVTDSFNQINIWTALKTRYYRKAINSSMELTNIPDSTMVSSLLLLACFSSSIGARLSRVCLGFAFFTFPRFVSSSTSPFPSSRLVSMVESNGCSTDCKQEFVRRIQ